MTGAAVSGESKGERTRARIMDAAARVLGRRGYAGTRLSEIAEEAKLQTPTIYYHFASRDELIQSVIHVGTADVNLHVREVLQSLPDGPGGPMDRIDAAVEAHLRMALEMSDYTIAAVRNSQQLPPPLRETFRADAEAYGAVWRDLVLSARDAGQLRSDANLFITTMLILGSLNWAAEWWRPGLIPIESAVVTAQTMVRRGLEAGAVETPAARSSSGVRGMNFAPAHAGYDKVYGVDADAPTDQRILDAAAEVLSRKGYAGTKLTEIAEIAGIRSPAIYRYFRSRDELVETVMTVGHRRFVEYVSAAVEQLPDSATPIDRILAAIAAHLHLSLEFSHYAAASIRNMNQMPDRIREGQRDLRRAYLEIWRRQLADAAHAGQLRPELNLHAAEGLIIGGLSYSTEWWDPQHGNLPDLIYNAQRLIRIGIARREDVGDSVASP